MTDTGFHVPAEKLDRLPPYHRGERHAGRRRPLDGAADLPLRGRWPRLDARRLAPLRADAARRAAAISCPPDSVRLMTTDHLTQEQRDASTLFLEGAGWGFGGAVEPDGRYGWIGGTGTTGARRAVDRHRRRPPHAAVDDEADPTAAHARVLALRVRWFGSGRLKPINILVAENVEGRIDVAHALGSAAMLDVRLRPRARVRARARTTTSTTRSGCSSSRARSCVRAPDGEHTLERGDLVCFPPGPAGAHKVMNRSEAPARTLMFSSSARRRPSPSTRTATRSACGRRRGERPRLQARHGRAVVGWRGRLGQA